MHSNLDFEVCKNWSLELKDILYSAGLNQIYDNMIICNIDAAICICVNLLIGNIHYQLNLNYVHMSNLKKIWKLKATLNIAC